MPTPVTKLTRLESLYKRVRATHLPFVHHAKSMFMGQVGARLMVVFSHSVVDPLGRDAAYLRDALTFCKIDKAHTFFAYAIKGTLLKDEGGQLVTVSREARDDEMEVYREFLLEEIDIVKPKAVLCVGSVAIKTLLGDPHFSVTKMAGAEVHAPGVDCPVIATVSFSYVVKTGGTRSKAHKQFIGDLAHAKALSEETDF